MKNTSGAYVIIGVLLGVIATKCSYAEPGWSFLIIPAALTFIGALVVENS